MTTRHGKFVPPPLITFAPSPLEGNRGGSVVEESAERLSPALHERVEFRASTVSGRKS